VSNWTPAAIRSLRTRGGTAYGLDRRWTQAELAALVGVAQNTVARWERGERVPTHTDAVGGLDRVARNVRRRLKRKDKP